MIRSGRNFFTNGTTSRVEYMPRVCIHTSVAATPKLATNCSSNFCMLVSPRFRLWTTLM